MLHQWFMEENKIIIYQSEDGKTQIDVRLENNTVWLTQAQTAELFQTDRTSIVRHIQNIYKIGELDRESTCAKIAQVQTEGHRYVRRTIPYFNLDMIISVGYRINSKRGVKFRQWANKILKDYLIKGYAVNDNIRREQIGELRQLVGILGRTIQSQSLMPSEESQALFDVVTDYAYALDTLDNYDYERLTIEKTTQEERFHATYNNAIRAIEGLVAVACSATRRMIPSRAVLDKFTRPLEARNSILAWRKKPICYFISSQRTTPSATATSALPPRFSSGSSTTTAYSIVRTAPSGWPTTRSLPSR